MSHRTVLNLSKLCFERLLLSTGTSYDLYEMTSFSVHQHKLVLVLGKLLFKMKYIIHITCYLHSNVVCYITLLLCA